MTKTKDSQAQQNGSSFDPTAAWTKITQDSVERMQSLYDELAKWEAKAYERAKAAADQLSDLASESVTYFSNLTSEWRKLSLEATRRGVEMFKTPAA